MRPILKSNINIWYVLFWKGDNWWARGYNHVSTLGYCHSQECWLHLSTEKSGVVTRVMDNGNEVTELLALAAVVCTVIRMEGPFPEPGRMPLWWPLSCVSTVKHQFGIRSGASTPRALLRCFRQIGEEIKYDVTESKQHPIG